jgi:hypothetical protein
MSKEFDPDTLIAALAPFLGLAVEPEYRDGVKAHLRAAKTIAADVLAFEMPDDAEPAPVYKP